jgi:long-chain acyl-CoA synthetase
MSTFAQIIREHAQDRPEAPALSFEGSTWTFADLHRLSSRSAQALRLAGVNAGDRVALLTKNRAEFYELLFACSKIGAILVGLNWRLAAGEIEAIVADAKPKVALLGPDEEKLFNANTRVTPGLNKVVIFGAEFDAWRSDSQEDPGHVGQADDVALLMYTSGTTGLPKGVMLTNANMAFTRKLGEAWGMGPNSVNLVAMPMFHVGGTGYGTSTMMVGGHTVLMKEVNPAVAIDLIERYKVTHTFFVPAVVQSLLLTPGIEKADFSSLQLLMYGASPIGDVLLKQALTMFKCNFMQAYGMTETAGTVLDLPPQDHEPEGPRSGLLKSCGKAYPWVNLRIIDPTTFSDVKVGEVGEIWLQSGMVMLGYWNKPEATSEALQPGGWLRTGDAAYQDSEGYVYMFDRFKDMIISGGENIYPAEVENAMNAHPAVKEVGVIGVPHSRWGETPMAIVVLRSGHSVEPADLIAFTRDRLAHYKCPTSVVIANELPRNASGKLLKRELRRLHHKDKGHT